MFVSSCADQNARVAAKGTTSRAATNSLSMTSNTSSQNASKRKISDFHFSRALTRAEVTKLWGAPDERPGSGVDYWAYMLEDGRAVWLEFVPEPPFKLNRAILMSPNTGERRNIFEK